METCLQGQGQGLEQERGLEPWLAARGQEVAASSYRASCDRHTVKGLPFESLMMGLIKEGCVPWRSFLNKHKSECPDNTQAHT